MKFPKACKRFCDNYPWIPGTDPVKMCPIEREERIERRVLGMAKATGHNYAECPRFDTHPWSEKQKKAIEEIRRIPKSKDFLFFIFSPFGSGKTSALLCLCHECIEAGLYAEYTTAKRMRDIFLRRETNYEWFRNDGARETERWNDSDILCIDDLGWEGISKTGHFNQNIEPFLDRRGKKVVLAANMRYTAENFPLRHDPWIISRLKASKKIGWKDIDYREGKK